jgi:hypothetical protein
MAQTHKETSCYCHDRYSGAENKGNCKHCHHLGIEVAILEAKIFLSSPLSGVIEDLPLFKSKPRREIREKDILDIH